MGLGSISSLVLSEGDVMGKGVKDCLKLLLLENMWRESYRPLYPEYNNVF